MDLLFPQLAQVFFTLLIGHALCDFPLQGDFLAKLKNPELFPQERMWMWGLLWHSLIHAGAVLLITESYSLAILECVSHMVIDYFKCKRRLSFAGDQFLHIAFKALWAFLAVYCGSSLP